MEDDVRTTTPARITIFDTTLRDGEQAPGFSMREAEKVRLARKLDALGVDVLEAGFPIASEDDFNSVRAVAREVRRPVVAALARSRDADIDRAAHALEGAARPRIHTFLATSDLHLLFHPFTKYKTTNAVAIRLKIASGNKNCQPIFISWSYRYRGHVQRNQR